MEILPIGGMPTSRCHVYMRLSVRNPEGFERDSRSSAIIYRRSPPAGTFGSESLYVYVPLRPIRFTVVTELSIVLTFGVVYLWFNPDHTLWIIVTTHSWLVHTPG